MHHPCTMELVYGKDLHGSSTKFRKKQMVPFPFHRPFQWLVRLPFGFIAKRKIQRTLPHGKAILNHCSRNQAFCFAQSLIDT